MSFDDEDWLSNSLDFDDTKCPSLDAMGFRDPSPSFMQAQSPSRDISGIPFQEDLLRDNDINYEVEQGSTFQTMTTMQSTSYSDLQPMQQESGIPTYEQPTQVINGVYDNGIHMINAQTGYYQQQPGPSQTQQQHTVMHQNLNSNSPIMHSKPMTPQPILSQPSMLQQQQITAIPVQAHQQEAPPPSRSKQRIQPRQANGSRKKTNAGGQHTVGAVLAKANKLAAATDTRSNLGSNQAEMRFSKEQSEMVQSLSTEIDRLKTEQNERGIDHSVLIKDLEARRAGIFFEVLRQQHINFEMPQAGPSHIVQSPQIQRQTPRQVQHAASPQYQPLILQQQQYNQQSQQVVIQQQQPVQQIQMQSQQNVQHGMQQQIVTGQQQNQLQHNQVQQQQQTTQYFSHQNVKVSQPQHVVQVSNSVPQIQLRQTVTQHNRRAEPLYKQVQVSYVSQASTSSSTSNLIVYPCAPTSSQPQVLIQPTVPQQSPINSHSMNPMKLGQQGQSHYREPSVREVVQVRVGSSQSQGPSHVVLRQSGNVLCVPSPEITRKQMPQLHPQVLPPPPVVKFTPAQCAKRMEEKKLNRAQRLRDSMATLLSGVEDPRTEVPFVSLSDAMQRLLPYGLFHEPDLNSEALEEADTHILRSFVNMDERKKQLDNRFRRILYSQAEKGPEDMELNVLLYLDGEYERRKLEEEKKDIDDDTRESFVRNSTLIRDMREAGISDPKGQSRLGQAPMKTALGVYDYHDFYDIPSSEPRPLPSPSPPPRVYRSPTKSPLKSPVPSSRRSSVSSMKSPPPILQHQRRMADRATSRRSESSHRGNEAKFRETNKGVTSQNFILSPSQIKKEGSTPKRLSPIKSPVRSPPHRRLPPKLAAKAHDKRAREEEASPSIRCPPNRSQQLNTRNTIRKEPEIKATRHIRSPVREPELASTLKNELQPSKKDVEIKSSPLPCFRRASMAENNLDEEASDSSESLPPSPEISPYAAETSAPHQKKVQPENMRTSLKLLEEIKTEPVLEEKNEGLSSLKMSFSRPPPPRKMAGKDKTEEKTDIILHPEQTPKIPVSERIPDKKLPLKLRKSRTEQTVRDEMENHVPLTTEPPTAIIPVEPPVERIPLKLKISLGPRPLSQLSFAAEDNMSKSEETREKKPKKDKKRKKKKKSKHREEEESPAKKPKLEAVATEPCCSKSLSPSDIPPRVVLKFSLTKKLEERKYSTENSFANPNASSPVISRESSPSRPSLKVPPLKFPRGESSSSPVTAKIESPDSPDNNSRLHSSIPVQESQQKVPKLRIRLGGLQTVTPCPVLFTLPAVGSVSPDDALHIQFSPDGDDSDEERNRAATETDEALAMCGISLQTKPSSSASGSGLFSIP